MQLTHTIKPLTSKSRSFANRSLGLLKSGVSLCFLKAPYLSRYILQSQQGERHESKSNPL